MNPESLYHATQRGVDPKSWLLELHRQNTTGELRVDEIKNFSWADQKTVLMPIFKKASPPPDGIYLDQEGRQCLKLINVWGHTLDIIDEAVGRFYSLTEAYPDEIIPCPSRSFLRLSHYYAHDGIRIPYGDDWGSPIDYDVLCRRTIALVC